MTEIGYDDMLQRIEDIEVKTPQGKTAKELNAWITGYMTAKDDILGVLDELERGRWQA